MIKIFVDGSCLNYSKKPNPMLKVGGIGVAAIFKNHITTISEGPYLDVTSARMEVLAMVTAFETYAHTGKRIHVFSDNEYCVNTIRKGWIISWAGDGFLSGGELRPNADLWIRLLKVFNPELHTASWVKGHNKHKYNDLVDKLADEARFFKELKTEIKTNESI